jgi:hypothetical protein
VQSGKVRGFWANLSQVQKFGAGKEVPFTLPVEFCKLVSAPERPPEDWKGKMNVPVA